MAKTRPVPDEVMVLERWLEALADVYARIGHRFRWVEVRERVRRNLSGLLARVERKNGWQLAEAMGERDPHGAQCLLNETPLGTISLPASHRVLDGLRSRSASGAPSPAYFSGSNGRMVGSSPIPLVRRPPGRAAPAADTDLEGRDPPR